MYCCYFSKGTGLIGRLKTKDALEYVLLTCNHVIPTEEDAKSALFYFGYTNETKEPAPYKGRTILNTNGKWFWSDPAYHDQVSGWGSFEPCVTTGFVLQIFTYLHILVHTVATCYSI